MKITTTRFTGTALALLGLLIGTYSWGYQNAAPYTSASRYNLGGQVTGTIAPDPDGAGNLHFLASRNTYNSVGLLVRSERGELSQWADENIAPENWSGFTVTASQVFNYDAYGRQSFDQTLDNTGTAQALTQTNYDQQGHIKCRAERLNPSTYTNLPDACTLTPTGPQGPDRIRFFRYDERDQVLSEARAGNTDLVQIYTTNTYDGRRLTSQTDANGNRTELRYDPAYKRLIKQVYPSATVAGTVNENDYVEFSNFDRSGNLGTRRQRDQTLIRYEYDARNRLIEKIFPDPNQKVSYSYDLRNRLVRVNNFIGESLVNTFDGADRQTAATLNMGGYVRSLKYTYDANGNRTQLTHPDGTAFTYSFDELNRVAAVRELNDPSPAPLMTVTYNSSGRRQALIRPNGTTTTYTSSDGLHLTRFSQSFANPTYNLTNSFAFNPANQITQLTLSNSLYNYTGNDNRSGVYAPNGLNQYKTVNGQTLTYDASANLASDTGTNYFYDTENRLLSTSGSANASFKYDPLGRLFESTINGAKTQFLYDGDALVAEYDGTTGALLKRYVHGDQVDEPWVQYNGSAVGAINRRYLHADHQGSIIAQSNSAGTVLATLAYDSFGIPATTNQDRFGYTGQIWFKELGLFYYKARFYAPKLGRFLQTDPVGYKDDLDLYSYVGNDPLNNSDPSGLAACPSGDKNCIDDPKSETQGNAPENGHPVTPKQGQLDEVVVKGYKNKKIGSDPIVNDTPYPGEQYGRIDANNATPVQGKQQRKFSCTDGTSGASNVLNAGDFSGADAAVHTHPSWAIPSPGPDDGAIPGSLGIANYGVSPVGAWAVESTASGYRARLVAGRWGASASSVRESVRGYNKGAGKGTSGKKCSYN